MKKNILLIIAVALVAWSCKQEPIAPREAKDAKMQTTHSIKQFLETYMSESGDYSPVRDRATRDNVRYVFSIDSIPTAGEDIVITGRVISDDAAGNLYKTMVIQDINDPKYALRISVDAGSIGGVYPLGQVINIRCNGLAVGRYAEQPQLCVASYNNNTYANKPEEKMGWAPGRIPFPRFQQAVEAVGMPDKKAIVVDTMTIAEINAVISRSVGNPNCKVDGFQELQGRLVCIKDVHFTNEYWNYGVATACINGNPSSDSNCGVFAPTTKGMGFPQGRLIADANGNKIAISTSEYADYAYTVLPGAEYTGTVVGILGYYFDNIKDTRNNDEAANWSISLRSLDDLQLTYQGQPWEPKEWGE